jgi:competence ComEA-like helix-hairpin-helix protein
MPSAERRALLLLLGLALAGQGVRHILTRPGEAPGEVQLLSTLSAGSPTAQRDSAMRRGRPLAAGERVDVNTAPASEFARLPRIGIGLAKTIVADRSAHGPFGGLQDLDRVSGIGAGLLKSLEPHLTFGTVPGGQSPPMPVGAVVGTTFAPPGPELPARRSAGRVDSALNVNRATAVELEALPGIGPSLARRIVADRESRGPFATVEALDRVPGIGPALVARLAAVVRAP